MVLSVKLFREKQTAFVIGPFGQINLMHSTITIE